MATQAPALNNYVKARGRLLINHVFFATMVLSTEFIENEKIETAATDMEVVWYNPKFLDSLDVPTTMFVIAHEIAHIMFMHGLRRGHRTHHKWNVACDHAINLILKDSGFSVWQNACCDPRYKGMSAEEIYDLLTDEEAQESGGVGDDLMEPGNLSPDEQDAIEQEIKQKVATAANAASMAGKMPAELEQIVKGIMQPPVDWRVRLRDFATKQRQDDESWTRRNRRYADVILPGRHSLTLGEVVVIGDTSGSVSIFKNYYAQLGEELGFIREYMRPERMRIVWSDYADCSKQQVFEEADDIKLEPVGGGGTDMRLPLEFVRQYEPEFVILLTDCETPWPNEPTPFPLIVLSVTSLDGPDWATTIHVKA